MQKCEICEKETDFIKKHHIHSKSLGGKNNYYNIANICSECHDKVHYGLIIIEGRFNGLKGDVLVWRKFFEKSIMNIKEPLVWLKPNSKQLQNKYLKLYKDNKHDKRK